MTRPPVPTAPAPSPVRRPAHALLPALLALPLLGGLPGCAGPAREGEEVSAVGSAGAIVTGRGTAGVPPRHLPSLEALRQALEEDDTATARALLRTLEARVRGEQRAGLEDVGATLEMVRGFGQVIGGRERVEALDLRLEVNLDADGRSVDVVLVCHNDWPSALTLEPGGAILRVHRTFANPSGELGELVRQAALPNLAELRIESGGPLEVPLGSFPLVLSQDVLAGRTHWRLDLRAGDVVEDGRPYPARDVPVGEVERVDLAPFLPNGALDPERLATDVLRPHMAIEAVMERCVRILPARYPEALDLLAPQVARATDAQLDHRLLPCLRWLTRGACPGSDLEEWRAWAAAAPWRESRAAVGGGLDMPASGE